ncbi:hypothetical protein OF829_15520 [Sphingomonas sp. LB-2]|uniref:hypothetical protein n=1 Tax=Sphingomonas caeni TaxID=2984949 RepID=UPI0022329008|nr:hypothetical protein [Sphingomonas caeni]MCW3848644.1 hypothetical protein [Sphingomonas caeni]
MANLHLSYRQFAARARADADLTTLDNVRERCLRAESAWLDMAIRQERFEANRAAREKGATPAAG